MAVPTVGGQVALTGAIGFPPGGTIYDVGATLDLRGPFSFATHLSLAKPDLVEEDITTFTAKFAYEVPGLGLSACPILGLEHSTYDVHFSGVEVNWRQLVLPVGFGIGRNVSVRGAAITVFGNPQYLYTHTSLNRDVLGNISSERSSAHELAVTGGARLRLDNMFGGVSIAYTSVDDWRHALYTFTLGILIGNER